MAADMAHAHAALDAARRLAHVIESQWRRHVFLALLRTLVDRYQAKEITNIDFEQAVEEVLPQSLWFENRKSLDCSSMAGVNGTAFPQFELSGAKFSRSARGLTASGVIRQSSAPFDLVTSVPVYGVAGEHQIYLGRVFARVPRRTLPYLPRPK